MKTDGRNRPRKSERVLGAYFAYTSLLALVLPIDPAMRARALAVNAAVAVSYALLLRAARRAEQSWPGTVRDWAPKRVKRMVV